MQFYRWQLQTAVHHQSLMRRDLEGMAWGPWGLNTPNNHPYNKLARNGDEVVSCHRENRMCQQEQQAIKYSKFDGYLYLARSCLQRACGQTAGHKLGGFKCPNRWNGSTAIRISKKGGALVVTTPTRNPRVSQQCRIKEFIPWRGTINCPLLGGETIQVLRDSTQMKGLKHAIRNTDNRGTWGEVSAVLQGDEALAPRWSKARAT